MANAEEHTWSGVAVAPFTLTFQFREVQTNRAVGGAFTFSNATWRTNYNKAMQSANGPNILADGLPVYFTAGPAQNPRGVPTTSLVTWVNTNAGKATDPKREIRVWLEQGGAVIGSEYLAIVKANAKAFSFRLSVNDA